MRTWSLTTSAACSIAICTSACWTQTFAPPGIPDSSPDYPPATSTHRAFITDKAFAADFGGLVGADARCQGEADGAGLGGTWLAWLADDTGDPTTRFNETTAYVGLDGVTIARDFGELVSGTTQNAIMSTPTRQNVAVECWTNVSAGGRAFAPGAIGEGGATNCANWTSRDTALWGGTGHNNTTEPEWTVWGGQSCDPDEVAGLHLYCFEQ